MTTLLTTQAELRATKHENGVYFLCATCNTGKPVHTDCGTGYGYDDNDKPICYDCCGKRDTAKMIETGKAVLYLTSPQKGQPEVINWPGTLRFPIGSRWRGRHNIARTRTDVWFRGPDGKRWHGVQLGENSDICRCQRTKKP